MSGDDDLTIPGLGATPPPSPTDATGPAEAATSIGSVGSTEVDSITAALASGSIDAAQAKSMLIERVVAEQLPPDASVEVAEAVRAEVEAMLADDPTLDALLAGA